MTESHRRLRDDIGVDAISSIRDDVSEAADFLRICGLESAWQSLGLNDNENQEDEHGHRAAREASKSSNESSRDLIDSLDCNQLGQRARIKRIPVDS